MVQRLPSAGPLRFFWSNRRMLCGAATCVRLKVVRVEGVVSPMFQELRFHGECVLGILVSGWCVFRMVPSLRFGLLFSGWKVLVVDFSLGLGLWLPG